MFGKDNSLISKYVKKVEKDIKEDE